MAGVRLLTWYKNVSIAKKLYFAVGIMALLIALELFTLWFAIGTLSSLRAYVGGEGLWSKGQKDAMYYLRKYEHTHKESDYQNFQQFMKVPLGDHKARVEMLKPNPDFEVARQGFIEGRNHPDDIDGMIKLIRRFHSIHYIEKAINIWAEADPLISQLAPIGEKLHKEVISPQPSQQIINGYLEQMESLNERLTVLEDEFSFTLGEASRWLEHLVLRLLFIVALTVEITGLIISISVSRSIQRGLNEIIEAAKAIARGDFSKKARKFSNDEIGILADSFNHMTSELEHSIAIQTQTEKSLQEYAHKLEQSNSSLEQFAYVASHDLQEPLRTITNFAGLLQEKHEGELDETSKRYMNYVVHSSERMKAMVRDLLYYSRLGKHKTTETIDCNAVVHEVIADMVVLINETDTTIKFEKLPTIQSNKIEIHLLFQNLINNAIKYRRKDVPPVIEIKAELQPDDMWKFAVKDNGIGIDSTYQHKIFIIFQRLHNEKEYPGTGIGLATCKKIVELNGGMIWMKSILGDGSTFYFTLPKAN